MYDVPHCSKRMLARSHLNAVKSCCRQYQLEPSMTTHWATIRHLKKGGNYPMHVAFQTLVGNAVLISKKEQAKSQKTPRKASSGLCLGYASHRLASCRPSAHFLESSYQRAESPTYILHMPDQVWSRFFTTGTTVGLYQY